MSTDYLPCFHSLLTEYSEAVYYSQYQLKKEPFLFTKNILHISNLRFQIRIMHGTK